MAEALPDGGSKVSQVAARDPGWAVPMGRTAPPWSVVRLLPIPWRALIALITYLGLAVLLFAQAWAHPFTSSVGYRGDADIVMWFFSWPPFALAHGLNPLFTTYLDSPAGVNLMSSTSMPLVATALSPVTSIFGPACAYNTGETLALALSAWSAYLMLRRYVAGDIAAGLGGRLYGLSPCVLVGSPRHRPFTMSFLRAHCH